MIARIAVGLASIALVAALGEVAVRVFDLGPRFAPVELRALRLSGDAALRYELLPGWNGEINSAGMRDREFALPKPSGIYAACA